MNTFTDNGMIGLSAIMLLFGCIFISACQPYSTKDEPSWKPLYKYRAKDIRSLKVVWDDKVYTPVQIGIQWWLRENLDVGEITMKTHQTDSGIQKWCYDDIATNCDKYGGLYSFEEITTNSVCPDGWHVPSIDDWNTLDDEVGGDGNSLKAIGEVSGTDSSKFSALLGGWRETGFGPYYDATDRAIFWSADVVKPAEKTANFFSLGEGDNTQFSTQPISRGSSVRCIKD